MSLPLTRQELAEIIGEKTLHETDKTQLAKSIAAYLTSEGEKINLDSLTRDIMQYRLEHGVVEAVAVSAHELTAEVIDDTKKLLKDHFPDATLISVNTRIDESLVGGVRVELPRETLDLSVRSKLNKFRRLVAEERN